jgi:MoxR-like ATPase
VTIGKETHPVPSPFLVMATQNPIESEGTYPLPEAQVDRFMLKVVVDYPAPADELTVIERALVEPAVLEQILSIDELLELQRVVREVYVDPMVQRYALRLALATRDLVGAGLAELAPYVEFGVSPRGPINLVLAARALALVRGRRYVVPEDVRELAKDVLRHRLVLAYDALAEDIGPDAILDPVLEAVPSPDDEFAKTLVA